MRAAVLVVITVLLLAGALAYRAPASLVAPRVGELTHERVTIVDTDGTLWKGRASVSVGDERLPLAWRLHPASLLHGEIALTLAPTDAGAATPRGEISSSRRGTEIRNFAIEIPAQLLVSAAIPRPRLDARGMIEISTNTLSWPFAPGGGAVDATWRSASVGLAGSEERVALGAVTAKLAASNGQLIGPLANRGGDFAIGGEMRVRADGSGGVDGVIRTRRADDPRRSALLALGTPEGDGVRVRWQWPAP